MKTSALLLAVSVVGLLATGALAQDGTKIQLGDNQKIFPESITTTADGTVYAGSIGVGSVFKAAPGEMKATAWTQPQTEGPPSITGVFADEKSGLLWVCYADLAAFGGGTPKPSVIRTYALADASFKSTYTFTDASFCNDFATTADGTAYVADTAGGRVMRIKPGATEVEAWKADPALAGVDGISLGPDGALYVNNVMTNKIFRLPIGSDGAPGELKEITTSTPLKGPDGMRFGDDGKLYVAENGAGQVDVLTITGDTATVQMLGSGYDAPTAVSKVGKTLYVGESKFSKMGGTEDPGQFYVYMIPASKP